MRSFAVLLALLGLALASQLPTRREINEEYFRAGREYRYRFDGHVSAGLVLPGEQAVTRLQTLVRLQPENDRYVRLQLSETRFGTVQKDAKKMIPFEKTEKVTMLEEYERILSLPIRFAYRQGLVSDIEFSHEEQAWSANIKRAVVNMLQVNLIKKGINEKMQSEWEMEQENDYFVATERTVEGECEVAYTKLQSSQQQQWTKSINFEKCALRPMVVYGRRFAERCEECDKSLSDEKLSSTIMTYNLTSTSNAKEYLIHSVELQSAHTLAPISETEQLMVVRVLNKMELIYAGEVRKEIPAVRGERKETLIYNPEWELAEEMFAMTGEEKYLKRIPYMSNRVEILKKVITKLSQEVDLESVHVLARVVKIVRLLTEEELSTMRRFVSEQPKQVQDLYIDCLALAGTKNTISYLLEKINIKEISPLKAAQLMKIFAEIRTPSQPILEQLYGFCESSREDYLRQSCWLTYGSLLNGVCGSHLDKFAVTYENKKMCTRAEKTAYVVQLIEKMNRAESRYEKVLFVKVLANAGIDTSITELEKIILNKKFETIIRVQAVEALRRLRSVMPKKIQNVLLPIYKNHREPAELRMACLTILLQTQPEQGVLDLIVRSIPQMSQQVKIFTYTSLVNLKETTNPCEKVFGRRVAQALISLPEPEMTKLSSKAKTFDYFYGLTGANVDLRALFTNDSVLPKEISSSIETLFGGHWHKYMAQVGLVQNNLDQVLSKLIEKVETSGFEKLVVRGKRSSVFEKPADMLRTLFQSLKINHRRINSDEPHAMLYFRYKDMDYAFLPLDIDSFPEMIRKIVRNGEIDLSELENLFMGRHTNYNGALFFHEYVRSFPTAVGMPVYFSVKLPTVASLPGSLKVDFEPKNSDKFTGLRLKLSAQPKIARTHVTKVEIMTPVVSSGAKLLHSLRTQIPIDMEIHANWEQKMTIKTVVRMPETRRHVLHMSSRPVVFYRHSHKTHHQYPEAKEMTINTTPLYLEQPKDMTKVFEKYGVKYTVSGQYVPTTNKNWFLAENALDFHVEPKQDSPKEIVSHLTVHTFEPIEMEKPTMFHNFFENNAELFTTETEREESPRREAFYNYIKDLKLVKAYRHRLHMKVNVEQEEMEFGLRGECDESLRFCRFKMDVQVPQTESKPWEMRLTAESLYPEMPTSFKRMYSQRHREFTGAVQARWGSEEKNDVLIRIQGEQTPEARNNWMKKVDREQNSLMEEQKLRRASKLNQYKFLVDYELTPENKLNLDQLQAVVMSWKPWRTTVSVAEKELNKMIQVQLSCEYEDLWNMTAWTEEKKIEISEFEMPLIPKGNIRAHYGAVRSMEHVVKRVVKESRSECVVKSKEVKSFDGQWFKTPLTGCYSVLAKDCGKEEPEFAVLLKKINKEGEKKLKVISREYEIVMQRSDDKEMTIFVNGKEVTDRDQWEQYGITEEGRMYKIDIDSVVVYFDGVVAKVQISEMYKNRQCGLCGHFDGEMTNDFRRADNEETSDLEEFHRSFITKDEECRMEESELSKKTNYKLLDEETSSSEEDYEETREPVLRHRVIERNHEVCFSTEPMKTCPKNTRQEKYSEETVSFKCLRRSDSYAQRLLRNARKGENLIEEIAELSVAFEEEIRVPRMCSVY